MYNKNKITDIIFGTREEAEDTLSTMREIMKNYGRVKVADVYDRVGVDSEYTDNQYILLPNILCDAEVLRTKVGYIINVPDPVYSPHYDIRYPRYRSYSKPKAPASKPTPHALTITVNTNFVDNISDTLTAIFEYVHTITDRDVTISIM